jgi:nicotinamidase-related amidase
VLTGLSSYSGILASSYVMQDNGYRFVVPKQCVTGYDPELHAAAMRLMAPQIVDVHDIVGYWTAAST